MGASPAGRPGKEIGGLRTRTSRTYTVDDAPGQGSRLVRLSAGSINYQDANGDWKAIDNSLEPTLGGYANKANRYEAKVPDSLADGGRVSVSEGGDSLAFSLRDVAKTSQSHVEGARITYTDAFPGVDVTYQAQPDALKELLSLASAGARRSFIYDLNPSAGLRPTLTDSGALELKDADGQVAMSVPAPYMYDAAGKTSHAVHFALDRVEAGWRLTMTAGDEWLASPDRKFPVKVDPQVVPNAQADCGLDTDDPDGSYCGGTEMWAGRGGTVAHDHHSVVRFDVPAAVPDGADVTYAALGLYLRAQWGTEAKRLVVNRLTHAFTSGATWNAWDGSSVWSTSGGDFDPAEACTYCFYVGGPAGGGGDQPGNWTYANIRDLTSDWATGAKANYGLLVREDPTTSSSINNLFYFDTAEVAGTQPVLDIRYEPRMGFIRGHKYESQRLTDRLGLAVNPSNGNLLLSAHDLTVPGGLGPDLSLDRTYNSLQTSQLAFGQGFGMSTGPDVSMEETNEGDMVYHGPSGTHALFKRVPGSSTDYTTPAGFDAKLVKDTVANQWVYTENASQRKLTFDVMGRLIRDEDRNNRANTFAYTSGTNRIASITDSQSRTTSFTYTSGRITKMTDPASRDTIYAYNGSGQLTSWTDPNAGTTSIDYGTYGPTLITTPAGHKTKIAYYATGAMTGRVLSVMRVTNPSAALGSMVGPTTQFAYTQTQDGAGTSNVTDPDGNLVKSTFNTAGLPTTTVDGLNQTTKTEYTTNANVKSFILSGNTGTTPNTNLSYDSDNNLSGSQTPTSSAACSATSRVASCINTNIDSGSAGGVPSSVLGANYLPGKVTNEQGRVQNLGYDAKGNPTTVSSTTGTITLGYDAAKPGKLDTIQDQRSKTTSLTYNAAGDITQITPPLPLGPTVLTYTASLSRIATVTDGKGQVRTLSYDGDDRVTNIAYAGGTNVAFVYDKDGNLTARNDSVGGNTTYTLDQLARVTYESLPGGRSNSYGYDPASNLTSSTDPSGTTTYGYDAANRNSSVKEPGAAVAITLGYDNDGRRSTTSYPNGVVMTRSYDAAGRLSGVKSVKTSTATVLQDVSYVYYATAGAGEGTIKSRAIDNLTGRTTKYDYDDQDRLLQARTYTTATPPADPLSTCAVDGQLACYLYGMDAASNRLSKTVTGSTIPSSTSSYAYNDANQLATKTVAGATTSYTYDPNGNQLTRPAGGLPRASSYNIRDQATNINGTAIGYLGAGQDQVVSEGSTVLQNNLLGMGIRTIGSTTDYYTREVDGTPLAQRTGSGRQYYVLDALGSVTATTNSSGASQVTYAYDPDGNTTATTGSSTNPLGYAGGYQAPSGLIHYGQRYYDPDQARWTQQDPLNQATDLRQANRYAYVGTDPINNTDPSGLNLLDDADRLVSKVPKVLKKVARPVCYVYKSFEKGTNDFEAVNKCYNPYYFAKDAKNLVDDR